MKPINISTSAALFRWRPACWLRVTGDDAAVFLQGQFSNELRELPRARSIYGLWLTVKGKVLADSMVMSNGTRTEFWIGSYFSPASVIRERLESHVIADDVTIEDLTASVAGVSILDGAVEDFVERSSGDSPFLFSGRRDRSRNAELVYFTSSGEPDWISAGAQFAPWLDVDEMARRRIAAGIPAIPRDVGQNDLPNEGGLETEAISYTKGCYLGQEVMARLKSMGRLRRRLLRVRGDGESFPTTPAQVFAGSRLVGDLRSAVRDGTGGWIGLAMISLMHVVTGAELSFAASAPPQLRLVDAP